MAKAAQIFPEVSFHDTIVDPSKVQVVLCFAAAGGSAHIAWMTSAETNTPVIAIPVEDSSTGHIAALYSMINMPPGVPNGFVLNQEIAAMLGKRIMQLTAQEVEKVYIPEDMMQESLQKLIEQFGIAVTHTAGEATLWIHTQRVDEDQLSKIELSHLPVIIPTVQPGKMIDNADIHKNLMHLEWLTMGLQLEGKINPTNAFLYCMKLVALFNKEVDQQLTTYRNTLAQEVTRKDAALLEQQITSWILNQALDVVLPARYTRVHGGKVRETYQHPDHPDQLIMIATDRISTHDVVHKNRIPGKGEVLTQVSNFRSQYFREQEATKDIPTQNIENVVFPADFPKSYKARTVIVKKLSPLPLEAIVREYLYGSAFTGYNAKTGKLATGEEVGIGLQKCSRFSTPLFTPSTKWKTDININTESMKELIRTWLEKEYPQFIHQADTYATQVEQYSLAMFTTARDYAAQKWICIADTKFEFAIDENGILQVIDETLTPDSSRFWENDSVQEGKEPIQLDKQPARESAMKIWNGWKKVPVSFPQDVIDTTQERYRKVRDIFKA